MLNQGGGKEKRTKSTGVVKLHVVVYGMNDGKRPCFERVDIAIFVGNHVPVACIDHGLVFVSIVLWE